MENRIFGRVHKKAEGDSRKVTFIASTADKDRHGTVVNQKNWDLTHFNSNPITGYQHNVYGMGMCTPPNPDDVLGPAKAWTSNNTLMVEIDFETKDLNPLADKIFRKIQNGSLRAVSVGFSELGEGKYGEGEEARGAENETYYFEGQELLEVSVVNIPSNRQALKKSYKNSTASAISYVSRMLGSQYTYREIGEMKVDEVIKLINNIEDGNISNDQKHFARSVQEESRSEEKETKKEEGKERRGGVVVSGDEIMISLDKLKDGQKHIKESKQDASDVKANRMERRKRLYSLITTNTL